MLQLLLRMDEEDAAAASTAAVDVVVDEVNVEDADVTVNVGVTASMRGSPM